MFSAEVDQARNALRRIPLQLALQNLPHQPVLGGSLSLSQGFRLSLSPGFTSVQRNPFGSPTPPPLPKKRLCSVEVSASRSKGPSFSSTSCWSSSSLSTTVLRNLVARGSQCRYDGVRSTGGSPDGLEGVVNWLIHGLDNSSGDRAVGSGCVPRERRRPWWVQCNGFIEYLFCAEPDWVMFSEYAHDNGCRLWRSVLYRRF